MTKQKSDLSRAFSEDGAIKTHVGGQALIEGVMMRGKYNWAVAVREPDGAIYVEEHDLTSGKDKNGWMYWPLVRGCRALVESLMLGFKALEIAALHAFGDEEGEQKAAAEATDEAIDYEVTLTDGLGDREGGGRLRASGDGHLHGGGTRAGRGAVHCGAGGHHEPHRGGVRRPHAGLEHRGRPSARGRVRLLHLAHRPHGGHQAHVHVPRRRAQGHPLLRARPSHDPRQRPPVPAPARALRAPPSSSWSWSSLSSCTPSSL